MRIQENIFRMKMLSMNNAMYLSQLRLKELSTRVMQQDTSVKLLVKQPTVQPQLLEKKFS